MSRKIGLQSLGVLYDHAAALLANAKGCNDLLAQVPPEAATRIAEAAALMVAARQKLLSIANPEQVANG